MFREDWDFCAVSKYRLSPKTTTTTTTNTSISDILKSKSLLHDHNHIITYILELISKCLYVVDEWTVNKTTKSTTAEAKFLTRITFAAFIFSEVEFFTLIHSCFRERWGLSSGVRGDVITMELILSFRHCH